MTCPNCQTVCGEADRFCFRCGTPLGEEQPKKGTHIIPVLLLIGLSLLGIALFFILPLSDTPTDPLSDTPWFSIEAGALYFDPSLYTGGSELVIPETVDGQAVEIIGSFCFAECTELSSIELPRTLRRIESQAFLNCTSLRGIFLPEGLVSIGAEAFYGCSALEAISIPSTVESIKPGVFEGCAKLFYIFYNGSFSSWRSLYSGYITPYTQIACTDGIYLQP